ncbi:MAG: lipid A deacylase LpxR family protein [Prolixibacteraceae bacterium]
MIKHFILFTALFFSEQSLPAATSDSASVRKYHEILASWDNDVLMQTDYYYTQGVMAQTVLPVLERNPVNFLFFRMKRARNYFGLAVRQEIYTPINIEATWIVSNDRPYAGTLYVRSLKVSNNEDRRIKLTSQLDLGVLGPASVAGYCQRIIHEINGLLPPNGWSNQIRNKPYINYNVQLDKGLAERPGSMEVLYSVGARAGNIYDDLQIGVKFRTGMISSYFNGVTTQDMTLNSHRDILAYFYGGLNGKAVFYNSLLTGGMFSTDNPYVLKTSEISHFIFSGYAGIFLGYKGIGAKLEFFEQSPEFAGGLHHGWSTIGAVISF